MGEPFFVTKERFPHSPSKKVILDIAFFVYKHLYASGTLSPPEKSFRIIIGCLGRAMCRRHGSPIHFFHIPDLFSISSKFFKEKKP